MKKLLVATCAAASLLFSGAVFAAEEAATEAHPHPEVDAEILNLLQESACLNCHNVTPQETTEMTPETELPFGPPYLLIAQRYHGQENAVENLMRTVREGSNPYGKHWKEESAGIAMPPMITVSEETVKTLLTWILDLDEATAKAAEEALAVAEAEAKAAEKAE